ncbi:hypothetical protein VTN00DRAFT_8294 [Thermoascus crustaceus]|uniref:uncharacterized protein n=1 Tax=Thermoascus crustaceus TaxID=5088 RepID=UPI0037443A0C
MIKSAPKGDKWRWEESLPNVEASDRDMHYRNSDGIPSSHRPYLYRPNRCKWSKPVSFLKWAAVITFIGYLAVKNYITSGLRFKETLEDTPSPHIAAPSLCQTPECIHAASEILYNLDPNYTNIDPCTDFDQYVCGGWRERHDMRPDQGSIFAGTYMEENSQTLLRHVLESPQPLVKTAVEAADAEVFQKLKAQYDACVDEATLRERGAKPLEDILAQIEKIYPAGNLTSAVVYLMEIGVEALTSFSISQDDRNPDSVAIFVAPPREIGLPAREYYNNTKNVADYTAVLEKVLGGFRGESSSSLEGNLAHDIVAFETKLANATPDTQTQEDVTKSYNPRTIDEVHSLLPEISFSDIIATLGPENFTTNRLIVGSPSYLKELSTILKVTSTETVQWFLKWKAIQGYASSIEDRRITPLVEFNNQLQGKDPKAREDRWRKCISVVDNELPWILSRFYVLEAFSEEAKKLGDQIVSDIKERFVFTLDQTQWMSPEVRKLGIEKVGNIIQKIGYPTKSPNVMDPANLKQYYAGLELSNKTFFENQVSIAKFDLHREWSKLGKPADRDEWGMSAPTVNAYYNPPGNEIVFPAGIMQVPVFYGPSAPLYLSYGAFGAVSGHELSHAFDSTGRHYDQTGNYTNWWDNKTVEAFEQRAQCFVDQYSNFTVPGPDDKPLHVNGRLTLGENIADAGGLTAAFHAWKKRDDASSDPMLPGLSDFTKEQLFFVSYASWWCSKTTKEAAIRAIYNDPHAPKPARIIGTMANSREFREAFNCPVKEPTCKLW